MGVVRKYRCFLFFRMFLSLYDHQSKQIQEGVNRLEKQGNHKSKYNNRFTKIKKRTQA